MDRTCMLMWHLLILPWCNLSLDDDIYEYELSTFGLGATCTLLKGTVKVHI
jgi:hypothetical protein